MSEAQSLEARDRREGGAPPGPRMAVDVLSMYAFVALGLPDGMIGTAWPALRHGFGAPLGDLGIVLLVVMIGSVASSSVAGLVLARAGIRSTIMLAGTIAGLGAVGIIASPAFWVFVVSGVGLGVGGGLLDSSVNTSVALAGRNRLLNMLHGFYGVGAALGPLVVTAAVLAASWRPAYGALLLVEVGLVAGWWLGGRQAQRKAVLEHDSSDLPVVPVGSPPLALPAPAPALSTAPAAMAGPGSGTFHPGPAPVAGGRLRLAVVVTLGLVIFMVYTGIEVSAGQWEPSFDRGLLRLGAGATGLATFGYWGALTLVRFALAVPRRPVPPVTIVRWGCALGLLGAGLVWWRPSAVVALLGLVVIGGALAGVFPALVSLTPSRVGQSVAHHVIGWQIGAAAIGGSSISAIFGVIFQRYGLRNFGPALVIMAALLIVGVLVLERTSVADEVG